MLGLEPEPLDLGWATSSKLRYSVVDPFRLPDCARVTGLGAEEEKAILLAEVTQDLPYWCFAFVMNEEEEEEEEEQQQQQL